MNERVHDYRNWTNSIGDPPNVVCVECGYHNRRYAWWTMTADEPEPPCEPEKYRLMWSVSLGRGHTWREPIHQEEQ